MKGISAAAFALLFWGPLYGAGTESSSATACVYQYKGEVQMLEPDAQSWVTLKSAVPLPEGARLKTGPKAWCQVLAGDGTFLNLYENSEAVVEKLRLEKESRDYGFNFLRGRILCMVAKLKNKISKVEVRTPSAVCAVRGTDFSVDVASAATDIGLFEGQLNIQNGGKETPLSAGGEAVAGPGSVLVSARFSRLMEAEKRRYLKLQAHVEDLRSKLAAREGFIDEFVRTQQKKLQDFEDRRRKKLDKRGK